MILRNGGGGLSVAFDMPTLVAAGQGDHRAAAPAGHGLASHLRKSFQGRSS
ncbi:hypothetical protein SFUMM280S_08252 [Streptomyces fumanus]